MEHAATALLATDIAAVNASILKHLYCTIILHNTREFLKLDYIRKKYHTRAMCGTQLVYCRTIHLLI